MTSHHADHEAQIIRARDFLHTYSTSGIMPTILRERASGLITSTELLESDLTKCINMAISSGTLHARALALDDIAAMIRLEY